MRSLPQLVLPVLVVVGLAVATPLPATDLPTPAASVTQARYILHVDGMT